MQIDRRRALALLGVGAATPAPAMAAAQAGTFRHGGASGDPLADRVVLWTRFTPRTPGAPAVVYWEICADAACTRRVTGGQVRAEAARDYTVKVDAKGLKPATDYWYRFSTLGFRSRGLSDADSPVGHTRTLPVGPTKDVVLAVANCALYPGGYFNAYQAIADLPRVDVVLHLGDYIYEYGLDEYGKATGKALNRLPDPPHECVTLDDYRLRHACHKTDTQAQAAHARAPWIVVWDDHETADNSWSGGAENHDPDKGEGDWGARKAAAIRAYYEWMPIREPKRGADGFASWRAFDFGDLVRLIMTETRLTARGHQLDYKDDLPTKDGKPDLPAFQARWNDPSRRMMGADQEAWIVKALAGSVRAGQAWQVIGNQVVMARVRSPDFKALMGEAAFTAGLASVSPYYRKGVAQLSALGALGLPYNLDAWDGYPADRQRLYAAFTAARAHPVVLSGDSHAFWANELFDEPGGRRVAAEFGAAGVTSPGFGDVLKEMPVDRSLESQNDEVVFTDQGAKGFVLLTITREAVRADLMAVSTIMSLTFQTKALKSFEVKATPGGGVEALREV